MEKSATYSEESIAKNTLIINKKLATGKFTVYHAHCPSKNADYALKVFPKDSYGASQYKREKLMSKFSHPNIIQYIPIKCHTSSFYALVTEYAPYGDFFDAVTKGVLNNEVLVRTYFHQLIEGLEYIHSQGVAHLDLKLENLLLAANFTLKIIDFDQAQPLTEEGIKSKGTMCYRAPEVTNSSCKDFLAADIYSAGIVLYVLKAKEYPFVERKSQRGWELLFYDQFVEKNDAYWKWKNESNENKVPFGEDFIELLNGMLCPEPEKRLNLKDIKESKWYKGPVLDQESLQIEMKARWECVMKKKPEPSQPSAPAPRARVERPNRGRVESQ